MLDHKTEMLEPLQYAQLIESAEVYIGEIDLDID